MTEAQIIIDRAMDERCEQHWIICPKCGEDMFLKFEKENGQSTVSSISCEYGCKREYKVLLEEIR